MTIPLALTQLRAPEHPGALLIVGPALGTAIAPLWAPCVTHLPLDLTVIGWDLPGHGDTAPYDEPFTVADLAQAVTAATESARDRATGMVLYAGVSLGGAVGLALAIEQMPELDGVVAIATGVTLGEESHWRERAELVRASGTGAVLEASAQRWFTPETVDRDPDTTTALLDTLKAVEQHSYARCCEALASYDVRADLGTVTMPVLALAGEQDEGSPLPMAEAIAAGASGQARSIPDARHLATVDAPADVAHAIVEFLAGPVADASAW